MEADWRWAGRMRFDETELVMFVMLLRVDRSCADLGLGVAKLGSFSPSGVAYLEAALAMAGQSCRSGWVRGCMSAVRFRNGKALEPVGGEIVATAASEQDGGGLSASKRERVERA